VFFTNWSAKSSLQIFQHLDSEQPLSGSHPKQRCMWPLQLLSRNNAYGYDFTNLITSRR